MDDTTRRAFFDHVSRALSTADTAGIHPPTAVVVPVEYVRAGTTYHVEDMLVARGQDAMPLGTPPLEEQLLVLEALETAVRRQRYTIERYLRGVQLPSAEPPNAG